MKTFKRPMFRRGGNVGGGIMSNVTQRSNYSIGGGARSPEEVKAIIEQIKSVSPRSSNLSNLLIQGGLGLAAGKGAGKGTLGAVATAFEKPTQEFFKAEEAERGLDLALASKLIQTDGVRYSGIGKVANELMMTDPGKYPDTPAGRKKAYNDARGIVKTKVGLTPEEKYYKDVDLYAKHPAGSEAAAGMKQKYGNKIQILPKNAYSYDSSAKTYIANPNFAGNPNVVYGDPITGKLFKSVKGEDGIYRLQEVTTTE